MDDADEVATNYAYSPFGATEATGDADSNPFAYTGRELDETGLYHYRARYNDPELGRFISEDPIGFEGGDPNLYSYVGNDPLNRTDPTGLCYSMNGVVMELGADRRESDLSSRPVRVGVRWPGRLDQTSATARHLPARGQPRRGRHRRHGLSGEWSSK